eukprot:GHVP01050162.1.p1 GENE.GHVP01050162.1~~GHVP01050162.1.p1  ORF type:complete len:489 (+),score=99.31 GHVP01050162.1:530-1996(+)
MAFDSEIAPKEAAKMDELTALLKTFDWKDDLILTAKELIASREKQQIVKGVSKLKGILCIAREQVFSIAEEVIKSEVVPSLIEFIQIEDEELQLSAAFCLTNVAAGSDEQTDYLVRQGAIGPLLKLLESQNDQLRRQALFCLANIAGSAPKHREILLRDFPEYYSLVFRSASQSPHLLGEAKIMEIVAWNLRNLSVLPGLPYSARLPAFHWFIENFQTNKSSAVLARHSIEALTACSKFPEGLNIIMRDENLLKCLYDCALSYPQSNTVRTCSLEIIHSSVMAGGFSAARDFVRSGEGLTLCCSILREQSNPEILRRTAAHLLAHLTTVPLSEIDGQQISFQILLGQIGQSVGDEDPDVVEQTGIAFCRWISACPSEFYFDNTTKLVLDFVKKSAMRGFSKNASQFPMTTALPNEPPEPSALFVALKALATLLEMGVQLAQLADGENPVKRTVQFLGGQQILSAVGENVEYKEAHLLAVETLKRHFIN